MEFGPGEMKFDDSFGVGPSTEEEYLDREARARAKNREAQQRFRQRQRAKQQEAAEECARIENQMNELSLEIEAIKRENTVMEKVLAVRDAIFTAYRETTNERQCLGDLHEAGQDLALAIDDLNAEPGLSELCAELEVCTEEVTVLKMAEQVGVAEQQALPAVRDSTAGSDGVPQTGEPSSDTSATRTSTELLPNLQATMLMSSSLAEGQVLDGSSLERVENIPPPTNSEVAQAVKAMENPDDMVKYWRAWTMDLKKAWEEAYSAKFSAPTVAKLDECMGVMTEMWWHAAQLKPAFLAHLTYAALPENSGQLEQWAIIAEKVYPELSDKDIEIMREAWWQYTKRMAKTAIAASEWATELQQLQLEEGYSGLHATATKSLKVAELAAMVAEAIQEEYTASMEFVANQALALTMVQKAFMNYAAIPYMPDVSAIVYHVLKLAEREPRQDVVITAVDDTGGSSQ